MIDMELRTTDALKNICHAVRERYKKIKSAWKSVTLTRYFGASMSLQPEQDLDPSSDFCRARTRLYIYTQTDTPRHGNIDRSSPRVVHSMRPKIIFKTILSLNTCRLQYDALMSATGTLKLQDWTL